MKKGKGFFIASLVLGVYAFIATSLSLSCAWFMTSNHLPSSVSISGSSAGAYFAYGTGTEDDPFGIRVPRHLYNLAWLQYSGMFNRDSDEDGEIDKQYYFEIDPSITNPIDMTGYTLPPIGTEDNPFLGSFNGNGKTITNLTVSNQSTFARKPNKVDYDVQPEIVGFFGVVGALDGYSYEYDSSVVSVEDVTLDNLTVASKTSQTLIGLAAGYVDGAMSGVRLSGNATLDLDGQTSTALTDITSKLSDYGLVGYTKNEAFGGTYAQKLSEYYDSSTGTGQGTGDEWGGSFNSRLYNRWIYDLFKGYNAAGYETSSIQTGSNKSNTYTTDDYKLVFTSAFKTEYSTSWKRYTYYQDPDRMNAPNDGFNPPGTLQPANVFQLRDGAYLPLRFSDDMLSTHLQNTGYLVGANVNAAFQGSPKLSTYYYGNIGNSLQGTSWSRSTAYSDKSLAYTDSKLELLTYSTKDSAWYRIKDSHNSANTTTNSTLTSKAANTRTVDQLGFEKYNASRDSLQTSLESSLRLQGIHFEGVSVSTSNILSVASNIKVNGTKYNSTYQLPKGSINFNLKSTGFINFFAGTYYTSDRTYNFFSLYDVKRTGGTINSIKRITKIYQNKYWDSSTLSNATTNPKFFYKYSDNSFSNIVVNGSTRAATESDKDTAQGNSGLVFDVATALEANCTTNNAMFYFEIPVNNGEYAMGMVPDKDAATYTGAYLVYLDIGANGDVVESDKVTAYSIVTQKTGNKYPAGVDFIPVTVAGGGGESIGVSIASSKKGVLVFSVIKEDTSNSISGEIEITDSSSISTYAFKGTKYSDLSTPSPGDFKMSGNSPGALVVPSAGGTRVLEGTFVRKSDSATFNFRVTDALTDNAGSFTESESVYQLDSGSGYATSTKAAINTMIDQTTNIDTLRALAIAATLTLGSGTNEFTTVYDTENCSYSGKVIDVDVTTNGSTVDIAVTTGYTLKIGGTTYSTGSTYPSS